MKMPGTRMLIYSTQCFLILGFVCSSCHGIPWLSLKIANVALHVVVRFPWLRNIQHHLINIKQRNFPRLFILIHDVLFREDVQNWYVPLSRSRLPRSGEICPMECQEGYQVHNDGWLHQDLIPKNEMMTINRWLIFSGEKSSNEVYASTST